MENIDLLAESYDYDLDPTFIADRPIEGRHNSKLLVYNMRTREVVHSHFNEIATFLTPEHLLVLNQSKVFPCRLVGLKDSGGKVEVFLLSLIHKNGHYPCLLYTSPSPRD